MNHFYAKDLRKRYTASLRKSIFFLLFIIAAITASAQKIATTSGNWSDASTWVPAIVPTSDDAVIINPGVTVTVNVANAVAASLQLNIPGVGSQSSTLLFNTGSQLTITNTLTMGQVVDRPGIIDMTAGGTLRAGNINVGLFGTSDFIEGAGTLVLTGNGSLPHPLFDYLNNLTIAGGTTSINGTTKLYGDLDVQNGTLDLTSYTLSREGAQAGTVSIASNAMLRVGATSGFPGNFSVYTLAASSTVEFYGSTQLVRGITYGNLIFNGGTKTANGPVTVMGDLTTNADFNAATYTHNIYDDWSNTGNFNAGTSTIEFFGVTDQEIPGVTYNNLRNTNTAGYLLAKGNITVNGTYTSTSIMNVLDMDTYMLALGTSGTVSNRGTVKTQNTSATPLPLDQSWGIGTAGTVLYYAPNGGQTIVRGVYNNLEVEHMNGGESSVNGDIQIGGNISAKNIATTINMGTFQLQHMVSGGIGSQFNVGTIRTQNTSLLPFPAGRTWGGTVVFDAPGGGQKISFGSYNNLTVNSGAGSTENISPTIYIDGAFTSSATTKINMNQDTIDGNFDATGFLGTIRTQAQITAFTTGRTWGGTVIYDAYGGSAGAQYIISGNYHNLTISQARGLNSNVTFPATISVSGDLNLTAVVEGTGAFIMTGNTFNFNGTGPQQINVTANSSATSQPFMFNNVIISGGGTKTLSSMMDIDGNLQLTNGVVKTTSSNMMRLSANASVTAPAMGSNVSYIDGPVRKLGTTAFSFPVGTAGVYAPVSIGAPGTGGDFTAEYKRPQSIGTAYTAPLQRVSPCEYWNVTKNAGANDPAITLSWSASSNCGSGLYVTDLSTLAIAQWNGSTWVNAGNSATSGTTNMGTVTSSATAPYGNITLASTSAVTNPLPVKIIGVTAMQISEGIKIDWTVVTEVNLAYYDVQRSVNAIEFDGIVKVTALNATGTLRYDALDKTATGNIVYYRIKAVDKDGKISYSNVVKVNLAKGNTRMEVYPNPVSGNSITFSVSGLAKGSYTLNMYDMSGRIVYRQNVLVQHNAITQSIALPAGMNKGTYHLKLIGANGIHLNNSFIVE